MLGIRKNVIVKRPVRSVPVMAIGFDPNLFVSRPAAKLPTIKSMIAPIFSNTIESVDIENR